MDVFGGHTRRAIWILGMSRVMCAKNCECTQFVLMLLSSLHSSNVCDCLKSVFFLLARYLPFAAGFSAVDVPSDQEVCVQSSDDAFRQTGWEKPEVIRRFGMRMRRRHNVSSMSEECFIRDCVRSLFGVMHSRLYGVLFMEDHHGFLMEVFFLFFSISTLLAKCAAQSARENCEESRRIHANA